MAKSRVEKRGKREGDSGFPEDTRDALGIEVEIDAKSGKDIRGSRCRTGSAVAVLDDRHSRGSGYDRCHGGDVYRSEPITTGTHYVECHRVDRQGQGVLQYRVPKSDDLIDGLAFGSQGDKKTRKLGGGRISIHHLLHGPRCFADSKIFAI